MLNKHRFCVKQTPFLCETNPFLCETTLSPCGRSCIFVDGSVSLGTAPFFIRQNRFCVDGSFSAFTRGNI